MASLPRHSIRLAVLAGFSLALALGACSSNSTSGKGNGGSPGGGGVQESGGAASAGGTVATGGSTATALAGGTVAAGGSIQTSGGSIGAGGTSAAGGSPTRGGSTATGGSTAVGGSSAAGGASAGAPATGGTAVSGGTTATGGTTASGGAAGGGGGGTTASGGVAGGTTASGGGTTATGGRAGGTTATGGSTATGGTTASGGNTGGSRGGTTGTGGATAGTTASGGSTTSGDGGPAADTSSFHCVNWADPGDNFQAGVLQPTGLSSSDSYATVSAKADAILSGFQTLLNANSIRIPINEPTTTNAAWWAAYKGIIDTATSKNMKVIIGYWYKPGVGTVQDMTAFYAMWQAVVDAYGANDLVYFDIINEPSGYSATAFINLAVQWLAQYPSVPKSHVLVAGTGTDTDVNQQGADSRLAGCLLSLHLYPFSGTALDDTGWRNYVKTHVGNYYTRTIATEYGAPMTTGLDYAGPIGTTVEIAYMTGVPNQFRDYKMGSCLWVGLRNTDFTSITKLNGTGTNLSLSVNNASGLARLQWGWGL